MKLKNITENLTNKIPKVLLIIVVLFGLSLNRNSMFGNEIIKKENPNSAIITSIAEKQFAQKVTVKSDDDVVYEIMDSRNATIGYVLSSLNMNDLRRGYAGKTPIAVILDNNRKITSVQMLKNNETPSFVATLVKGGYFDKWVGQNMDEKLAHPDAISGVTLTSLAVRANMDALSNCTVQTKIAEKPSHDGKTIFAQCAILIVVALSLWCYFFPAKSRKLRIPVLVLSIGVLGIWQGAFISIDLLTKWLFFGVSFSGRFAMVAIVAFALLIPLLFSRSWYCNYLCPFGALQELLGKINPQKLHIPQNVLTLFRWIRQLFLVVIILLLLFVPKFDTASVEPFTVFMLKSAAMSVIIIAAISLISSIFIQRAWCRLLCPTGEIMSILQRKVTIKKEENETASNPDNNRDNTPFMQK